MGKRPARPKDIITGKFIDWSPLVRYQWEEDKRTEIYWKEFRKRIAEYEQENTNNK